MSETEEKEEEIVEEEEKVEKEEEEKRKPKAKSEVVIDLDDMVIKEALKDVLAVNEEIPKEPTVKSEELRELINFKEECEALMELIRPYMPEDKIDNMLTDNFDIKKAMEIAAKMAGLDGNEEELLDGEPSPYVKELFKKIWQKYIDCKWFEAMMKGKKPVMPKDLKFVKAPEDLVKAEGEKI
ncbi:MAG: hypothetical protein JHC26_12695 [Thermofilum sp.]|jgi:hypothetical protein|uniref:hypothetical protein n=1 Tax=Thermofilum sp. TaxID=1961369 RepID=UPI00258C4A6E|nr:hypothetical protein [Thermofilum sp.]MCI4409944.1 hypothetical protein [Thermofilum sp.]